MGIGKRIAQLRKQKNLTQSDLAKMIYVSPKTISKWENGYGLPDIKSLPAIADALGVDCGFLLTGEKDVTPDKPSFMFDLGGESQIQTGQLDKNGKESEVLDVNANAMDNRKQKENSPKREVYKLRLHQVTHNHLTKWVLFLNVFALVVSLVCGPVNLKIDGYDRFNAMSAISILQDLFFSSYSNGWVVAIGIVWTVVFLFVAVSSIVMLVGTLNGANEYYVRTSAIQFACIMGLGILSVVGSWFSNLYEGENVMTVNVGYFLLAIGSFLQLVLNIFISRHNKAVGKLKIIFAWGFAFLTAFCLVGASIPQRAVVSALDESSIEFTQIEFEVSENKAESNGYSWYVYKGNGMVAVTANAKITYLYDGTISFNKGNYTQIMFADCEYLATKYHAGKYVNFFNISFTASGHESEVEPEKIDNFNYSCAVTNDGKIYNITSKTRIIKDNLGKIAQVEYSGGELNSKFYNRIYTLTFSGDVTVLGYSVTEGCSLELFAGGIEYSVVGKDGKGESVYKSIGVCEWQPLSQSDANFIVQKVRQKVGVEYKDIAVFCLRAQIAEIKDLVLSIDICIKTNMGDVIITIPIDRDTVIENYLKNI